MMKRNILILVISIISNFSYSQTLPVEELVNHVNSEEGLAESGITKIKDLNNVFDKFIGTWTGVFENITYKVYIVEKTITSNDIEEDTLLLRYEIINSQNMTVESTKLFEDSSPFILKGDYIDEKGFYHFNFEGGVSDCGLDGYLILSVSGSAMSVTLIPKGDYQYYCSSQTPNVIFPTESISLNKI